MDLRELVRALIESGERDPDVITKTALTAVLESGDPFGALYPAVRNFISADIRNYTRLAEEEWDAAEREAAKAQRRGDHRTAPRNDATKARNRLVVIKFFSPGHGWVPWGTATVEQHQAASEHSQRIASGHQKDAKRHQKAISLIENASVSCLNEIPGFLVEDPEGYLDEDAA